MEEEEEEGEELATVGGRDVGWCAWEVEGGVEETEGGREEEGGWEEEEEEGGWEEEASEGPTNFLVIAGESLDAVVPVRSGAPAVRGESWG